MQGPTRPIKLRPLPTPTPPSNKAEVMPTLQPSVLGAIGKAQQGFSQMFQRISFTEQPFDPFGAPPSTLPIPQPAGEEVLDVGDIKSGAIQPRKFSEQHTGPKGQRNSPFFIL